MGWEQWPAVFPLYFQRRHSAARCSRPLRAATCDDPSVAGVQVQPKISSNGRMNGAAGPANSTILPAEQSAALRDRLVSEIAGLESQDSAVAWAGGASSQEHAHWNRCKNGGNRICPEAIRFFSGKRPRTVAPEFASNDCSGCYACAVLRFQPGNLFDETIAQHSRLVGGENG